MDEFSEGLKHDLGKFAHVLDDLGLSIIELRFSGKFSAISTNYFINHTRRLH